MLNKLVLCIGAQKSGTSFLYRALEADERIATPQVKEVHYFDVKHGVESRRHQKRVLRQLMSSLRGKDLTHTLGVDQNDLSTNIRLTMMRFGVFGDWNYSRLLQSNHKDTHLCCFEASPSYALVPKRGFEDMLSQSHDTQLIFIMRDPVVRLWSAAKYIFRKRLETGAATPEDVCEFFVSRVRNQKSIGFRHSNYAATLNNINEIGAKNRLTVLFQEDLNNPNEMIRLADAFGFIPNYKSDIQPGTTHKQHFPLPDELRDEAIYAFSNVYSTVKANYTDRIPESWYC